VSLPGEDRGERQAKCSSCSDGSHVHSPIRNA
jgi:hypothetical protein